MNLLGKYVKAKRRKYRVTLRQFCRDVGYDPSNWSKIERGLLTPPMDYRMLNNIAELSRTSRLWIYFLAKISRGELPEYSEKELVKKLPLFLPKKLTEKQLDNLIKLIKEDEFQ